MTPNRTPRGAAERRDTGFTLVEILIAIVLVGILSAVVVVGVGSLTDQGEASACTASSDAAKAGSVVYFAQNGAYPSSFADMVADGALTLADDVTIDATERILTGSGWTLTLTGDGSAAPTFACA
jgi:prepilin-type N-terminal cleavage/methylation domain-containing protein